MKLKIKLLVIVAIATVFGLISAKAESQYDMFAFWVRGPVRTNTVSSPAYDAWASNMVWMLYTNQTTVTDTNQTSVTNVDVGYRLLAEDITQLDPNLLTNYTLHLAVRIVGKNGAKVSLGMLRFLEKSSDEPWNSLSNSYSLLNVTGLVYDVRAIGVVYGPGGARVSDSIDILGSGNGLKDEIDFIGMDSQYYTGTMLEVSNYIHSYPLGFELTGTCEIVTTNGVAGFVQRTLQVSGQPIQPRLSIILTNAVNVRIGVNFETNRTVVIQSRPKFSPASTPWMIEGTINANDILFRSSKDVPSRFYRAWLE